MHVVWDWNGTLLADLSLVVAATSASLQASGGSVVDLVAYRTAFQRPVRAFYEHLLRKPLNDAEWTRAEAAFHDHYYRELADCRLVDGAEDALLTLGSDGLTQSLLSMWRHDELVALLQRRGLDQFLAPRCFVWVGE